MSFRKDFVWGTATAAYQVEGAAFEDGKGLSIWDDFSHTPGKVYGNHTGDVACDQYHLYRDDVALMVKLGVKNYRFSVAWARVLPEGTGTPNEAGLAYYDHLIDCLLENGIRPLVTLFHWDLPLALHRRGGWLNPQSPHWFEDYTRLVASRFGTRVLDYFTFNEPQCAIGVGYASGHMAPGIKASLTDTILMSHNVHLAHGLAVQQLRQSVPGVRVGFVGCGSVAIPATDSPLDVEAARVAYFAYPDADPVSWAFSVAWWADPVMLGSYPEDGLTHYGQYLPHDFEKKLSIIAQPLDYYAHNIYEGSRYRFDEKTGYAAVPWPVGYPRTAIDWPITPDALYWGPRYLWERYHKPIFITENGMSARDVVSLDGQVHDPNRVDYMHRYLLALRRAAADGVEVYGYLAWSLLDNFEWSKGYSERFGLVHVDYQTLKRTPKDSALWYRHIMETNGEAL